MVLKFVKNWSKFGHKSFINRSKISFYSYHFIHFLGWTWLLFEPFRKASDPPGPDCITDCQESLQLLQSCPIASEVGVSQLIKECQRLGLENLMGVLQPISVTIENLK